MKNILIVLIMYYLSCIHLAAQTPELKLQMPVKIDFQSYSGSGFAPLEGQGRLDSRAWRVTGLSDGNMEFSGTYLGGDYGRGVSPGKVSSGGVYAFQVNTNTRILGFQATGTDLLPGYLTVKIKVTEIDSVESLRIRYKAFIMNDQNRSTAVQFHWSTDDKTYTVIKDLGFETPLASHLNPAWQGIDLESFLVATHFQDAEYLYLRWYMNDAGGTGSRDEWGIAELNLELLTKRSDDDETNPISVPHPTQAARDIQILNRTDSMLSLRWKNGNGSARLVLLKPQETTTCLPTDKTSYVTRIYPSPSDTTKGACVVLYNGSSASAIITGLKSSHDHFIQIIEYNGSIGHERYLLSDVANAMFKTRSKAPNPLISLRSVYQSSDQIVIQWEQPEQTFVRVVASDEILSDEQLLAYESDAYQEIEPPKNHLLCLDQNPCVIDRFNLQSSTIQAWTVSGDLGHRSVQKESPRYLKINWDEFDKGILLSEWLFNLDTDQKTNVVWDYQDASFTIKGARDIGYAPGSNGRARSADQWDQSNSSKAWSFTIPTWGLSEVHLSFRLMSSSTGPSDFKLRCSVNGTLIEQDKIFKAGSNWSQSIAHETTLPKECLNSEEFVQLYLVAEGTIAINGNQVSKTGTSRLDYMIIRGKKNNLSKPLLRLPTIDQISDDSIHVQSYWISSAIQVPIRRYLRFFSEEKSIEVDMYPLAPRKMTTSISHLERNDVINLQFCVETVLHQICSDSISYRPPLKPPARLENATIIPTAMDTLLIELKQKSEDIWVVISSSGNLIPEGVDSVGIKEDKKNPWVYSKRHFNPQAITITHLKPGAMYNVWLIPVVGVDSVMRFSKTPHFYRNIQMPELPAPKNEIQNIHFKHLSANHIQFIWEGGSTHPVLWTIGPSSTPINFPTNDIAYVSSPLFGRGDTLNFNTFVVSTSNSQTLEVRGIPMDIELTLRAYVYTTYNGAISYNTSDIKEYHFNGLEDPRKHLKTVSDLVGYHITKPFALLGTVADLQSNDLILWSDGGNVRLRWNGIKLNKGDSIAVLVNKSANQLQALYHLDLDSSRTSDFPIFEVLSTTHKEIILSKHYVALGNLLSTGRKCDSNGHLLLQRGEKRRVVCIYNIPSPIFNNAPGKEHAVLGIPIWSDQGHLSIWITQPNDVFTYGFDQITPVSPIINQSYTWTAGKNDSIEFKWSRKLGVRYYDNWPDSTENVHLFATRIAGHHQPFIIRRIIDTNSIAYQLSDLHKSHLDDDTLALTIDLEWAVWNQLKSHAFLLENQVPWQPLKIIRIKGLLDSESTHNVVEFSVSKPRPNPFNPITTFDVVLPSTGHITISAYDVLGRRIDLIRNETLSAGIHEIHWDAQKYTSGVYFLRVDYQNKVFYNRVSLIK